MRAVGIAVVAVVLSLGGLAWGQPKYIVLSDTTWPPFEWVSEKGAYLGFDLDVMRAIAILEGFEIEIREMPFDSIIPAVIARKGDIGASGFTITAERAQVVDFSQPYWSSVQAVVARVGSGLDKEKALAKGRMVGAQRGTTGAMWVADHYVPQGVRLVLYETYPEAILDLLAGRLDAVVQDIDPSKQAVCENPGKVEIVGVIDTGENFGFLVAKGDPKGILPKLHAGMAKLKASGAWDLLIEAYFGRPDDPFCPSIEAIEAAWEKCISILLKDRDPLKYAQALAAEVKKK